MINADIFFSSIKSVVDSVLKDLGLLENEWHYGTITRVNGDGTVNVRIDGSTDSTNYVTCNPDIRIQETDKVIILYVNRNKQNPYVMCKKNS